MRLLGLLCMLAFVGDPVTAAEPTAALSAAEAAVEAAETPQERLVALGALTEAQGAALMALRATLRAMPARRAALEADLAPLDEARFRMMAGLHRLSRLPPAVRLAHPDGPLAALRAMTVTAGLASDAAAAAAEMQATLDALDNLAATRASAMAALEETHAALMVARDEIGASLQQAGDASATVDLPNLAATLAAAALDSTDGVAQRAALGASRGTLPLPAAGTGRRDGFGIIMALPPWAVVTSPTLATVRHAGPLRPLGNVVVLEPAPGALIVLQGLDGLRVSAGTVVAAGQPVGLVGTDLPRAEAFVTMTPDELAGQRRESLYIEFWLDGRREDAASWFALDPQAPSRLQ